MEKIFNINKPKGITSFDAVEYIKRNFFPSEKVGHAGTLDPMAEGVLIICIGKATKSVSSFVECEKEYTGEITFGIATDSFDAMGKVLSTVEDIDISADEVKKVFLSFEGESGQIPPMFSALKHKGRHLYEFARQGKTIERKPRKICIKNFDLTNFTKDKFSKAEFRVVCSKGTYIRTLAEESGKKLGCGAHLSKLVRTRIGNFLIENSIKLDELQWKL